MYLSESAAILVFLVLVLLWLIPVVTGAVSGYVTARLSRGVGIGFGMWAGAIYGMLAECVNFWTFSLVSSWGMETIIVLNVLLAILIPMVVVRFKAVRRREPLPR